MKTTKNLHKHTQLYLTTFYSFDKLMKEIAYFKIRDMTYTYNIYNSYCGETSKSQKLVLRGPLLMRLVDYEDQMGERSAKKKKETVKSFKGWGDNQLQFG